VVPQSGAARHPGGVTSAPTRRSLAGSVLPTIALVVTLAVIVGSSSGLFDRRPDPVPVDDQLCGLPRPWLIRMQRGYHPERSGQIAILPRYPAYMGTAEGGWSHSGPWGYLQRVPLVFYGPGITRAGASVDRPVTLADVAPTLMTTLRGSFQTDDGGSLDEVVRVGPGLVGRARPRLIFVVVLDGGGWNVLDRWPDAWPNLKRLMDGGVSYTRATVGSSPSVTPSVHTTLGTGVFPWQHGITGIPVRDEEGAVVDAFLEGRSGRFMEALALAERWDEFRDGRALIGMFGYEPWHLGMIGRGAEVPNADKDHAFWLDRETNTWATNPDHYSLPSVIEATGGLESDLEKLDARDGAVDGAWGDLDILDDRDRIEETPAFVTYHGRAMRALIEEEGYGADRVTDMLYTNFKQIDRLGHYFNMSSDQVREALEETDRQLGLTVDFLDEAVGRGRWLTVITADHGQQPDARDVNGYGIDPKEVARDIDEEFGSVTRAVWPTEVFLKPTADVDPAEVAHWLSGYRLAENTQRPDMLVGGAGTFDPNDRLFRVAAPAHRLATAPCGVRRTENPAR
jgi:hypothetical protein